MVEEVGSTLCDTVVKKDPSPQHCGRQKNLPCVTSPGRCKRPGVVYRISCNLCREEGKEEHEVEVYVGESARTAFDMGQSTGGQWLPWVEIAPWWSTRWQPMGQGRQASKGRWPTNMMRQALEAANTQALEGKNLLNRRGSGGRTSLLDWW